MEKRYHPGVMCIYLIQLVTPPHTLHIPEILPVRFMWLTAHSLLDGRLFVFFIWKRIFRTVQILALLISYIPHSILRPSHVRELP